jgi:hypothetical protein
MEVHLRLNSRAFLSSHSVHTRSKINVEVFLSEAAKRLTASGHHFTSSVRSEGTMLGKPRRVTPLSRSPLQKGTAALCGRWFLHGSHTVGT